MSRESPMLTTESCRICTSRELVDILDLGEQAPANCLRSSLTEAIPTLPLRVMRCSTCTTLQLRETFSPEFLFSHYVWVTGTSSTAVAFSYHFYDIVKARFASPDFSVLEVASNDGTFLRPFLEQGHRVLGVEPASNVQALACDAGIPTRNVFFSPETAQQLTNELGHFDCVIARNVLPHVENVRAFADAFARALSETGVGVIEFHYLSEIRDGLQYDSIYHEHVFYFSLHSVIHLLDQVGLHAFDVEDSPISGGAKVLFVSKQKRARSAKLDADRQNEVNTRLNTAETWTAFADACERHRDALRAILARESDAGRCVVGYGASARSSTLLNYAGISTADVVMIADQNPLKHGKFAAGTSIPIVSPDTAFGQPVDVVLLLAWNFKDEILHNLRTERQFTGDVIIPLPSEVVVDS